MAAKTICIKGTGIRSEALANAAITPGMLVEILATGKVRKHATAGGFAEKAFAVEDDLQGKKISDDYAINTLVQYEIFNAGDEVNAILKDGEAVVIGDRVVSSGAGLMQKADVDSASTVVEQMVIGVAMEALDLSDSSGADPASSRLRIRIV